MLGARALQFSAHAVEMRSRQDYNRLVRGLGTDTESDNELGETTGVLQCVRAGQESTLVPVSGALRAELVREVGRSSSFRSSVEGRRVLSFGHNNGGQGTRGGQKKKGGA